MNQLIDIDTIDLNKYPKGSPVRFFLALESVLDDNGIVMQKGPLHIGIRRGAEPFGQNEKGEGIYIIQEDSEIEGEEGLVFGLTSHFFNYI